VSRSALPFEEVRSVPPRHPVRALCVRAPWDELVELSIDSVEGGGVTGLRSAEPSPRLRSCSSDRHCFCSPAFRLSAGALAWLASDSLANTGAPRCRAPTLRSESVELLKQ
jgi:hypothetical protein